MLVKIPTPSKRTFLAFVILSATLHLAVCKLPVQSSVVQENIEPQVLQISVVSVAAPSVLGNATENKEKQETEKQEVKKLNEIQPAAGKASLPKSQEASQEDAKPVKDASAENKVVQLLTSNDKGSNTTTIVPVLNESDYIQTVAPVYPQRAISRGIEGVVIVRALITNTGEASQVHIFNSSGSELLDDSALKAVSLWKFKSSAMQKAEGMWVQVPVKFMIR